MSPASGPLLGERRRADFGPPVRSAGRPLGRPGRRGDRARRIARAGVAAALALAARQTGRLVPAGEPSPVPMEVPDLRTPDARGELEAIIDEAATAHGVSAHLVRAVVEVESGFDPSAVSPVGARGLMQLMPATAAHLGVSDALDPRQNVFGGVKYLSQLLDRFEGNVALALAGYNAGPTRVARYQGIPPFGETRGYVHKIRGLLAESTGVSFPLPTPPNVRKSVIRRVRAASPSRPRQHTTHHRRRPARGRRS